MSDIEIQLVNAVGGGDIQNEVDLRVLSEQIEAATNRYDPEHHPSLILKLNQDGATILLFRTGKYNIAGASSVGDLLTTNQDFLSKIDELGVKISTEDGLFEIRNLVYTHDFGKEFDLSALAVGLGMENAEYEPEQFPGLHYTPPNKNGMVIIFRTGKAVLTGINQESTATFIFNNLRNRLRDIEDL